MNAGLMTMSGRLHDNRQQERLCPALKTQFNNLKLQLRSSSSFRLKKAVRFAKRSGLVTREANREGKGRVQGQEGQGPQGNQGRREKSIKDAQSRIQKALVRKRAGRPAANAPSAASNPVRRIREGEPRFETRRHRAGNRCTRTAPPTAGQEGSRRRQGRRAPRRPTRPPDHFQRCLKGRSGGPFVFSPRIDR